MATQSGSQPGEPEEIIPAALNKLMAASAGRVWTRRKTKRAPDIWELVYLLVRVDLWRITAQPGMECPTDSAAWRKGDRIELARGQTVVEYIEGDVEWFVEFGEGCQEFRAESPAEAACWAAALKRRVCPWHKLLHEREVGGKGLLTSISDGDEMTGPISVDHLDVAQDMVQVLGEVAAFTHEVLGTLPIAGPILSLLAFAMQVVHRDMADVEKLQPAKSLLEEVAKLTIKALHRALKMDDKEYEQELLEVLQTIECAARMLECHEYRSKRKRIKQWLTMSKGPSAVLDLLKDCQDRLNNLKIDHIEEIGMLGLKKQDALLKKQDAVLANQQKLLAQKSLARRNRCSPPNIPPAPEAVALEGQLSIVRNMLLQSDSAFVLVWGMGGIGKTTLATALVSDPVVKQEFGKQVFVTVSQNPNIMQCQKRIWDALVGSEHNVQFTSEEDGKQSLQAALKDEAVFVVLDDLWEASDIAHFNVVSGKSRVLITSRNGEVATCVGARRYAAVALGEAESMELFCKHAFVSGQPLKWRAPYVRDIVQECGGLPLALKVMGAEAKGFCSGEDGATLSEERKKWKRAAEGIKSDGVVSKGVFDRVFAMSFDSLEEQHRAALLDLAMLPEDHEARECDVVEMQACNDLSADEAYDVMEELAQRSLIIRTGKYELDVCEFQSTGFVTCRLHDVVRDSALRLIAELPIPKRDRLVSSHLKKLSFKGQRLSATKFSATHNIGQDRLLDLQKLDMPELQGLVLRNAQVLELPASLLTANLVVVDLTSSGIISLPAQVACLRSVMVLRLDDCKKLSSLPNEVGDMEQLTVLSMRRCRGIYELPKSLGRPSNLTKLLMPGCGIAQFMPIDKGALQNLAVLDLSTCVGLKSLPPSLGELASLAALDLGGCWQLTSLPATVGQLAQLEVLLLHGCESLEELPSSVTLLGNLAELDVQGCTKLRCLPQGLADGCPELRILRLQQNSAMAFPNFVFDIEQLEVLGVHDDWTLPGCVNEKLQDQEMSLESLEREPTREYTSNQDMERDTPLHWAAALGMTQMVKFHLRETSIHIKSSIGDTALHKAGRHGRTATVELLLDRGASVDPVNQNGDTPLHRAVLYGNTACAEVLLDRGASVDPVNKISDTPLHSAAWYGQTASVKLLLDRGASVDPVNKMGNTPLHWASWYGHTASVELLLDRGASVNPVDKAGSTPMHKAAWYGHTAGLELLLDRGASVDRVDKIGNTPLHKAARHGQTASVELLLNRGASVDPVNQTGETPLHCATWCGQTAVVKLLLDRGASVEPVNQQGCTTLQLAAGGGSGAIFDLIYATYDSPPLEVQDEDGDTPLLQACLSGYLNIVERLLDCGANADAVNNAGSTPLTVVAKTGKKEIAELLLRRGAMAGVTDKNGRGPADHARNGGHLELAKMLEAAVDEQDEGTQG